MPPYDGKPLNIRKYFYIDAYYAMVNVLIKFLSHSNSFRDCNHHRYSAIVLSVAHYISRQLFVKGVRDSTPFRYFSNVTCSEWICQNVVA